MRFQRIFSTLSSVLLVGTAFLGGMSVYGGFLPTDAYARALADAPIKAYRACTVFCISNNCGYGAHQAIADAEIDERGGGSHVKCFDGGCGEQHPSCIGNLTSAQLEEIRRATLDGDLTQLQVVTRRYARSVQLAGSRQALQVRGCDDQVVAHFPLTGNQLAALTTSE
ncbi:MAG TPA: hypothetical protein VF263_05390, partial [Longimicrobiaceae bacterium]